MVQVVWVAALVCFLHGPQLVLTQSPWRIKTTSKYELRFYDSAARNFDTAKSLCESNFRSMVRMDNAEVRRTVEDTVRSARVVTYFWIGAKRYQNSYTWQWLDRTFITSSLLQWYGGQPDNSGGIENYLIIRKSDAKYGDVKYHFVYAGTICQRTLVRVHSLRASGLVLTEASTKEMTCSAYGYPAPAVMWKIGNSEIPTSTVHGGLYQIKYTGGARLMVQNAMVTDEGQNTCVAFNTVGSLREIVWLTVPSKPTILSIEPMSCNSSLYVTWTPHSRATGIRHWIRVSDNNGGSFDQEVPTPEDSLVQAFVTENLNSSALYTVMIAVICDSCRTSYSDTGENYTGGIPRRVETPTLRQLNQSCEVIWSWPKITPTSFITGFKVRVETMTSEVAAGTKVYSEVDEKIISRNLSFTIPKRPNRNHTVNISSQTCTGFGEAVMAKGSCITGVAAPESVKMPVSDLNDISPDGRLNFSLTIPSEVNGPISCIFVVIQGGNSSTLSVVNETELAKFNNSEVDDPYIVIADQKPSISGGAEINITLGNGSTTACNIHKGLKPKSKRSVKDGLYVGQNKPLSKEDIYKIYVVTSTPSKTGTVFFAISEPLEAKQKGRLEKTIPESQRVWVAPLIVVLLLVVLIVLVFFGVQLRRKKTLKQHSTDTRGQQPSTGSLETTIEAETRSGTHQEYEHVAEQGQSGRETATYENDRQYEEIEMPHYEEIKVNRHQGSDISTSNFQQTKEVIVDVEQTRALYENLHGDTKCQMSDFEAYYHRLLQERCSLFKSQFKQIGQRAAHDMKSTTVAAKPELKRKNRYKNVLPFDSTRVMLNGTSSGYINACFVDGFEVKGKFIATQGPLPSTVNDFWVMVVENGCRIIVMLAKCFEAGKKKCEKYWPDEGTSEIYGTITVHNWSEVKTGGFIMRKLNVSSDDQTIDVIQFQYPCWPDHGVPNKTSNLVRMHKAVVNAWKQTEALTPTIVHCSAGAGRTGTFIGYDYLVEQASYEGQVDVFNCVLKMRSQRVDMIQICDQYILVHKLLLEHYLFGDTDFNPQEITHKLVEINGERATRDLSTEFDNISRVLPVKTTSTKENTEENRNTVLVIPRRGETAPPYIDASWVETYDENIPMIAASGPDEDSVSFFWRAVSENRVNTIVVLSGAKERFQYWPAAVGETKSFNGVDVRLLGENGNGSLHERIIQISSGSRQCTVTQYQYSGWEVEQCPEDSRCIRKLIEDMQANIRKEDRAVALIHCSDGVGRTGSFCAIVNLIERLKAENRVDVFRAVKDLRECRPEMVQSLEQYVFCHRVISDYLKSFETYSNFG